MELFPVLYLIPTVHPRTDLFKAAPRQGLHRTLVIRDQLIAEKTMNDARALQFVREAKDRASISIAQPARIFPPQSSQGRQTGPAKRTNLVDHVRLQFVTDLARTAVHVRSPTLLLMSPANDPSGCSVPLPVIRYAHSPPSDEPVN